jgi:ligand-binding SRPBCC domain-containing protein
MMILPSARSLRQRDRVPTFEASAEFACPPATLFDFLIRPANLPRVSPPDLSLRLVHAPERAELGSRITVEGRNLGMRHRLTTIVTAMQPHDLLADEQVEGPFRKYKHERRLRESNGGVLLAEFIDYEPPGGMLGLLLSKSRLEQYITEMYDYRIRAMRALLNPPAGD